MLGHITYLSREAMTQKFDAHRLQPRDVHTQFETKFAVGSYLAYQGDRFVERFDANSYLTLTMAIDLFDLGGTRQELAAGACSVNCRWLVMSFSSDWLFPPFQSQEIVDGLIAGDKPVSYCNVQTDCGHDAFLLPNQLDVYGELIRAFLENLVRMETGERGAGDEAQRRPEGGSRKAKGIAADAVVELPQQAADLAPSSLALPSSLPAPTSIFRHHRLDYETIVDLISAGCQRVGPWLRHWWAAGAAAQIAATDALWESSGTSRPL